MTDTLDRKRSVTKDDFQNRPEGGVWFWHITDPGSVQSPALQLPRHGTPSRDQMLTATLDLEDMWAAAVNKAITKIAARGYEVSDQDDSSRKTEFGKTLVMHFDGQASYRSGVAKVLHDFLLTDNGYFIEIERASSSPGSRIRALWHLDSFRCWRTGNLDYPVLYVDEQGQWHKLRNDSVIFGADMPSPRRRMYGRGRCAGSRAFQTIIKLSAVELYFREKITGSRALQLHFISGASAKQLENAMTTSEAEKLRRGHVVYKGAVMVPIEGDQPITVATIDLAGVPDGFDVDQERRDAYLRYANALGVPVQDIQPLSGQGLGTGAQTIVLDEAAEGQGLAFFVRLFEDQINYLVMPKTTIFSFKTNDLRDQEQEAKTKKAKADWIVALMGSGQAPGVITQPQALNIAVDEGLVPKEMLPEDVTPAGVLTDSGDQSKPGEGTAPTVNPLLLAQQAAQAFALTKAARGVSDAELDDGWDEAVKWANDADEEATAPAVKEEKAEPHVIKRETYRPDKRTQALATQALKASKDTAGQFDGLAGQVEQRLVEHTTDVSGVLHAYDDRMGKIEEVLRAIRGKETQGDAQA
jgi:hypothetical protein